MKIGELIEALIEIKDDYIYEDSRMVAVESACNLLNKLPRMEEVATYEPIKDRVL